MFVGLKKTILKSTAMIMSVALVSLAVPSVRYFAGADSVSSMQDKKADLADKNKELQEEIDALKDSQADKQALADKYEEKLKNTKSMLNTVIEEINDTEVKINEKQAEIAQKEVELQDAKALFEERLRAIYMTGSTSQLELLLSAENLSDYLVRSELVKNVTEADNALMESIKQKMSEIEAAKAEIEDQKAKAEERKKDLQALNVQYTKELEELNAAIDSLSSQAKELDNQIAENDEAMEKLQAEIDAAIAESQKNNGDREFSNSNSSGGIVYKSDMFTWPLPNCYTISSKFGYRVNPVSGIYKLHAGTDIAKSGIYGSPIGAAADGIVIKRSYDSGGYGNYIMIDHGSFEGNHYVTLYAHMSSVAVSAGQTVKAGQTVGYVGDTGGVTGPHLHFEIRVNGSPTDPMNYFS